MNCKSERPAVTPFGWHLFEMPTGSSIITSHLGLGAIFSIDTMFDDDGNKVTRRRHLSLSRQNRYPSWDEMKEIVRGCGLFDNKKNIYMILPPEEEYVNFHPNTFHWWQDDDE
jgi:hypothetical protein